ncbi:MAG TPA: hypothetical protein EYN67_06925 [Flavobacteriales bacterium]|nr:hypothetical protein [Flavobacteriales bacterium]
MVECRKIGYATKKAAKYRITYLKAKGISNRGVKLRIYKCDECPCYHLTSYDAKSIKKMKDNRGK